MLMHCAERWQNISFRAASNNSLPGRGLDAPEPSRKTGGWRFEVVGKIVRFRHTSAAQRVTTEHPVPQPVRVHNGSLVRLMRTGCTTG